jgi:hypothetical protein
MVLLPSLQWHHCCPQVDIIALVVMPSLSSLMCRRPHCHHDEVVSLIVMVLLPLMRRHLCHHGYGNCPPHCDGVSAIVKLAYSSSWRCGPHNNGVVAVINNDWCCCPRQAGVFAPLHWCRRPCHTVVVILGALLLMPSSRRPLCPCCACIIHSLCRCLCPH